MRRRFCPVGIAAPVFQLPDALLQIPDYGFKLGPRFVTPLRTTSLTAFLTTSLTAFLEAVLPCYRNTFFCQKQESSVHQHCSTEGERGQPPIPLT